MLIYIGLGFGAGYAYYHPDKVKEALTKLIALIDKHNSKS